MKGDYAMKRMNDWMKKLAALLCALAMLLTMAPGVAVERSGPSGRRIFTGEWVIDGDTGSMAFVGGEKSAAQQDAVISAASATTVEEKVEQLAQECIAAGAESDYEIALWMHDWLIYNANYDYTFTEYEADGVLLKGTGVCQSYALAYELLLERMGIESEMLASDAMDHAWNLVCIDGVWCHVDCTWDDPNEGGYECHDYFGINDALMARDHEWDRSAYRACTSLEYFYPLVSGENCVDSMESLEAILAAEAGARNEVVDIYYIGESASFDLMSAVENWIDENFAQFDISGYGYSGSDYRVTVYISYWDSDDSDDEDHSMKLETPVAAPDFALNSPNGCYRLSSYGGNGIVLVFGRKTCANTRSLISKLGREVEALADSGVEVLLSMVGAQMPSDLADISAEFPGMNFVCDGGSLLNLYLEAVSYSSSSVTYPAVFVINGDGMITYYSTDYVSDVSELLDEAYAVATGNALPLPGENDYNQGTAGSGSINGIDSTGAETLRALAAESELLLYVTDYEMSYDSELLFMEYEANYEIYDRLGIRMAASYYDNTDASADYPHVSFFAYDPHLFWPLLEEAGHTDSGAYYKSAFKIDADGDIISYTNGSLMNPYMAAISMVNGVDCDVVTPADLSAIREEAFANADLKSVDLTGSLVYEIDDRAFAGCGNLELIKIPACVESIADTAFDGCNDLLIFCDAGSAAHAFAEANGILYLAK